MARFLAPTTHLSGWFLKSENRARHLLTDRLGPVLWAGSFRLSEIFCDSDFSLEGISIPL